MPIRLLGLIPILLVTGCLHAQTLSVDKQALPFAAQLNGPPFSQTVNLTSSGDPANPAIYLATAMKQSAPSFNWLSVSPPGSRSSSRRIKPFPPLKSRPGGRLRTGASPHHLCR